MRTTSRRDHHAAECRCSRQTTSIPPSRSPASVADGIATTQAAGGRFEVRPEVAAACNAELQRKLPTTVRGSGCSSWHLDAEGRNLTLWPGFTFDFIRRTRAFRADDFVLSQNS